MPENLEVDEKVTTFAHVNETSRDGAEVARWAHNPKVVGSNPAPATKRGSPFGGPLIFYMLGIGMCADSFVLTRTSGTQAAGACRVPARAAALAHRLRQAGCALRDSAPFPSLYAALPRWGSFSVGAYANRAESAAFAALRPVLGFKLALSYFAFASTSGAMSL